MGRAAWRSEPEAGWCTQRATASSASFLPRAVAPAFPPRSVHPPNYIAPSLTMGGQRPDVRVDGRRPSRLRSGDALSVESGPWRAGRGRHRRVSAKQEHNASTLRTIQANRCVRHRSSSRRQRAGLGCGCQQYATRLSRRQGSSTCSSETSHHRASAGVGCQSACGLPPAGAMLPSEDVATSVTVGADGYYYVGEARGFPATPGTSQVWRIAPDSVNALCNPAAPTTDQRYATRFTSLLRSAPGRKTGNFSLSSS